jgi:nicotinate-nucleotide adenylyltransferase
MGGATVGGSVTRGGAAPARTSGIRKPIATARIGMLGGTFDPIHAGHLALAHVALDQLGLDRVLFVPAGQPPHKRGRPITEAEDRLAMVELAIADEPRFGVTRMEIDRPGPSYTADTAEALVAGRREFDGEPVDLTVILSAESFADLPSWHDPARLLRLARIAVAPRLGHPAPTPGWLAQRLPGFADRVVVLEGPHLDVSASDIRARVAAGRSIEQLVPPPVVAHINAHHLYSEPQPRKGQS